MQSRRFRPHQIALGIGVGLGLVTGCRASPGGVGFARRVADPPRGVRQHPRRASSSPSTRCIPVLIVFGAVLFAQRMRNWERGAPDNRATTAKNVKRRLRGLPRRRLHADAAARSGRRRHALAHLLRVPRPARRSRPSWRSTTSCPTSLKFLHGDVYQALLVRRRRRRRRVPRRRGWAIVRRYVQRPYRIRIKSRPEHARDPRHVPRSSASPASSPRCSASRSTGRPTFEQWSFVGYPLSRLVDGRRPTSPGWHQALWVAPRRRLRGVPGDPARSRCCATCSPRR